MARASSISRRSTRNRTNSVQAILSKILGELQMEDDDVPGERISMLNRIMKMGVKDRVKLGMKGDREARNILIRDPNRLVSHGRCQQSPDHRTRDREDRVHALDLRGHPAADRSQPPMVSEL